jgi:hypothetical protein
MGFEGGKASISGEKATFFDEMKTFFWEIETLFATKAPSIEAMKLFFLAKNFYLEKKNLSWRQRKLLLASKRSGFWPRQWL